MLYIILCTLYTLPSTLCTEHYTQYTIHCTLYTNTCIMYTEHFTFYIVNCAGWRRSLSPAASTSAQCWRDITPTWSTTRPSTVLRWGCTVLHSTGYCTALHCAALHCSELACTAWHWHWHYFTFMSCTAVHYIALGKAQQCPSLYWVLHWRTLY